jgi:hypothetical protein
MIEKKPKTTQEAAERREKAPNKETADTAVSKKDFYVSSVPGVFRVRISRN